MTFDLRLTGQRPLVTGGTKGVGAAVVARAATIAGSEYIIDGGPIPTV